MLKKLEESVGKTIAALAGEFHHGQECLYFRFADGAVLGIEASNGGDESFIELASFDPTDNVQVKLGMIDRAECDRRAEEKFKAKQQSQEIREREVYERLKKKFENQ